MPTHHHTRHTLPPASHRGAAAFAAAAAAPLRGPKFLGSGLAFSCAAYICASGSQLPWSTRRKSERKDDALTKASYRESEPLVVQYCQPKRLSATRGRKCSGAYPTCARYTHAGR